MISLNYQIKPSGHHDSQIDLSAFLLNRTKQLASEKHLVFYNNVSTPNKSVALTETNGNQVQKCISIDFLTIDAEVEELMIYASVYDAETNKLTFSAFTECEVQITASNFTSPIYISDLIRDHASDSSIEIAWIKRWKRFWVADRFSVAAAGMHETTEKYL